jgi:hypothetical protein
LDAGDPRLLATDGLEEAGGFPPEAAGKLGREFDALGGIEKKIVQRDTNAKFCSYEY